MEPTKKFFKQKKSSKKNLTARSEPTLVQISEIISPPIRGRPYGEIISLIWTRLAYITHICITLNNMTNATINIIFTFNQNICYPAAVTKYFAMDLCNNTEVIKHKLCCITYKKIVNIFFVNSSLKSLWVICFSEIYFIPPAEYFHFEKSPTLCYSSYLYKLAIEFF